jgi:subtilase family serine protease
MMKSRFAMIGMSLLALTVALLGTAGSAFAQDLRPESTYIPESSVEHEGDNGVRVHTNHLLHVRSDTTIYTTPWGLAPDTVRAIYKLPLTKNLVAAVTGGRGTIAIVDAYDYPTAKADFDTFSAKFGLPLASQDVCNGAMACFKVVYAGGSKPSGNCSWNQEAALDIEWAHAMAPYAQIVLVEAASSNFTDLFNAVTVAANEVSCGSASCPSGSSGEGEVSMSWGGGEFSAETYYDSYLKKSGVVFVASSGDVGGIVEYPSISPDAVAAGGSSLEFRGAPSASTFTGEAAWCDGGGGKSLHEPRPAYQNGISLVGAARGVPDLSFDADPNSGVDVYDSTACGGYAGWLVFGGTSVAAPSLAGVINSAAHFYASSALELDTIYSIYNTKSSYAGDFRDITTGKARGFSAGPGWDFVTGVGSPLNYTGK